MCIIYIYAIYISRWYVRNYVRIYNVSGPGWGSLEVNSPNSPRLLGKRPTFLLFDPQWLRHPWNITVWSPSVRKALREAASCGAGSRVSDWMLQRWPSVASKCLWTVPDHPNGGSIYALANCGNRCLAQHGTTFGVFNQQARGCDMGMNICINQ
jgi:hypothetical protein